MSIEELEAQILYYATKYYNEEPEISDEQFDMLVERLRELNPKSKVLKTGWGFEVQDDKVKHKYSHIGSLDKCKSYEEIPDRFKMKTIYVSPKLDGLSAVAYYENGKLVRGVTRGNGEYGKDITDKLSIILGNSIGDRTFTGAVRGELIISNANWAVLQNKYNDLIAPRNFAAGIINRKDIDEDIEYVDMVVYKIVGQENKPIMTNRDDILGWLGLNFKHCIPKLYYPILNLVSWDTYHVQTFEQFKQLGYGLDGLVLTNPNVYYDSNNNGYVYDEVAFKFPAESTTTIIKNIEWEISRTQRLIPVAVIEPVELSGAIVERATCNNAKWVNDMELGCGAEVEICRSNEIIPKILSVLQPVSIKLPDVCPMCNSTLVWEGVDLKCANPKCANIELSDLRVWCENIGKTDGLQWTLMKQYLDFYSVKSIWQLYQKKDAILYDLNTKKLSITETKVKEFFDKLYGGNIPADVALVALNIPRLGDKTAKLLAKDRVLVEELLLYFIKLQQNLDVSDMTVKSRLYDVVKDATMETILLNGNKFLNLQYLYSDDFKTTRVLYSNNFMNNIKYVAVTGALYSMKRKDFESYISKYGYELTNNLKKCEYLITNSTESGSSKNKQAKEYGIPIITENEFLDKLKNF